MKYEDVKQWEDTFHTIPNQVNQRSEEYQKFKEKYTKTF